MLTPWLPLDYRFFLIDQMTHRWWGNWKRYWGSKLHSQPIVASVIMKYHFLIKLSIHSMRLLLRYVFVLFFINVLIYIKDVWFSFNYMLQKVFTRIMYIHCDVASVISLVSLWLTCYFFLFVCFLLLFWVYGVLFGIAIHIPVLEISFFFSFFLMKKLFFRL